MHVFGLFILLIFVELLTVAVKKNNLFHNLDFCCTNFRKKIKIIWNLSRMFVLKSIPLVINMFTGYLFKTSITV